MYNCYEEYIFCFSYKTSLPICPQIAWIHPNLYKTKALTQILVWLCSRVYEKQEAHGPNSLHDKHIQSFNVFVQSDRYTILRFSDKKNPYLLIKNWKLKFPSSKDVFVLSMVKIIPVVLKKIFVSFIANSFLSPLWKTA